jgi:hypothetical protein
MIASETSIRRRLHRLRLQGCWPQKNKTPNQSIEYRLPVLDPSMSDGRPLAADPDPVERSAAEIDHLPPLLYHSGQWTLGCPQRIPRDALSPSPVAAWRLQGSR